MEKRRNIRKLIFCGLLNTRFTRLRMSIFAVILSLFGGSVSFAVPRTEADANAFIARPVSSEILTGDDCVFALFIPNAAPDSVHIEDPVLPESAAFKSLTRMQRAGAIFGVQVELTVVFLEAGMYTLPPLSITVDGLRLSIPFASIEAQKNPKDVLPELCVRTADGSELGRTAFTTEAGKPVMLTVYVRNAAALASFSWKMPKDALFTELERFVAHSSDGNGNQQEIPLAQFEWIPFEEGLCALPYMCAAVIGFSGMHTEAVLPEICVTVIQAKKEAAAKQETLFTNAFDAAGSNTTTAPISRAVCQTLAELRYAERRAPFWGTEKHCRIRFEKEAGLPAGRPEGQFFMLFTLSGAAFIAIAALFIAVLRKTRAGIALFLTAAALCALSVLYAAKIFTVHAVFTGTALSAVPEASASSTPCRAGTIMRIKKSVGSWHYVTFLGGSGWVLQDDVILIR